MTPDPQSIRVFIALALPDTVRQRLAALQRELQTRWRGNPIRWTPADQIHLTLRFVGDISPHAVPALEAAVRRAAGGVAAFFLAASGSGSFPGERNPRVLWVGVTGDLAALTRLHERVREATQPWGETEARPFRPHLTIGRVKNLSPGRSPLSLRTGGPSGDVFGRWRVEEVLLMRSELAASGATHTVLARVPLTS